MSSSSSSSSPSSSSEGVAATSAETSSSSSLRALVHRMMQSYVKDHPEEYDPIDVYRAFEEEAALLFQTQRVRDHFVLDPYERLKEKFLRDDDDDHDGEEEFEEDKTENAEGMHQSTTTGYSDTMEQFLQKIQVTSYHHVTSKSGYVYTEAVVTMNLTDGNSTSLSFRYERDPGYDIDSGGEDPLLHAMGVEATSHGGSRMNNDVVLAPPSANTTISYSIECSHNYGPNQALLWVHVIAAKSEPSHRPAINMEDERDAFLLECQNGGTTGTGGGDNSEWRGATKRKRKESEDSGEDESGRNKSKRKRSGKDGNTPESGAGSSKNGRGGEGVEEGDRFVAGIDPDVLQQFLELANFGKIDDDVAFFLLMTFPFYETEWDLVGFVLDAVFGAEDDEDAEDGDEPEESDGHSDGDNDVGMAEDVDEKAAVVVESDKAAKHNNTSKKKSKKEK